MSGLRILDLHQHLWPQAFADLLQRRSHLPYLRDDVLTTREGSFLVETESNDLARRLEALDRAGIDVALISLQPTLGIDALPLTEQASLAAAYHGGIAELVAASGGRLRALAAGRVVEGFEGVCIGASHVLDPVGLADLLDALTYDRQTTTRRKA